MSFNLWSHASRVGEQRFRRTPHVGIDVTPSELLEPPAVEYTEPSRGLYDVVANHGVGLLQPGQERRSGQEEFYQLLNYVDDSDLNEKLIEWENFYNFHRPHGAFAGRTPYEIHRERLQ